MENKNRNTAAIGVFDSGVGGLTVTREIMRQLPNENVVYFGDTARVPYGSKSKNNIIRFSRQIIRFLLTRNVKAIVIACNTASAQALDVVKEELLDIIQNSKYSSDDKLAIVDTFKETAQKCLLNTQREEETGKAR